MKPCPHRTMYENIHSRLIHNHPTLETSTCPLVVNGCPTMVHPYNGIILYSKKKWASNPCNNRNESQKHYAKWNKLYAEAMIPLWHSGKTIIQRWKQIKWLGGWGWWGRLITKWQEEMLQVMELFYVFIVVVIITWLVFAFIKTQCCTLKSVSSHETVIRMKNES